MTTTPTVGRVVAELGARSRPSGRISLDKTFERRHFRHVPGPLARQLFFRQPEPLADDADRELLAMGLGATLYVPATHPDLPGAIARRAARGVCSMVVDLEDAIADEQVALAKRRLVHALDALARDRQLAPLVFVRVRDPESLTELAQRLGGGARIVTGFVFPKFDVHRGERYLRALTQVGEFWGRVVYGMPVLESAELVYRQSRHTQLAGLARLLGEHRDRILAVRTGATDMCSLFGIRRGRQMSIYDVRVVADVIGDIVNYLGRADGTGFVVTGPVWEYFGELGGLLREIGLDRANGIQGKTVIHPSHVPAVHALSVVTHEEYSDACDILRTDSGGVLASEYRNKMNERRPHSTWARRTLLRARAFGVAHQEVSGADLLHVLDAL